MASIHAAIFALASSDTEPPEGYPAFICGDCGDKQGRHSPDEGTTWHIGTCDLCGAEKVAVTEPRDFGHLKDGWEK